MENKELLFNELDKCVSVKLSASPSKNKWQKIPYKANGKSGVMLACGENSFPKPIEIDLKVKGTYKIYLCLGQITANTLMEISLSNEEGKTAIVPSNLFFVNGYPRWGVYEYAEEFLFKIADLTNNKIIINKPRNFECPVFHQPISCCLLYIRLEEVTSEELTEIKNSHNNKTVQYHLDADYFGECDYKTTSDYLGRIKMLENGNIDSVICESDFDSPFLKEPKCYYQKFRRNYKKAINKFNGKREEIFSKIADYVHLSNAEILHGHRLGFGDFALPYYQLNESSEQSKCKEYLCELRNGGKAGFLSYAYKEVRELKIKHIVETLPDYFDGVSLFFHRATCVLFEKPVIEKVMKDYQIDARKLPFSDYRLNETLSYFVTEFIKELKTALENKAKALNKKPYKINAVVFYDLESSKQFGYDVETWLKEDLIDSVSQGLMKYYEDTDGVLDENGLIDVDKYIEKENEQVVIKRCYDHDKTRIIDGAKGFNELTKKYGKKFYSALAWQHAPYEYQLDLAKKSYESGMENFICWNANHICQKPPVLNAVKEIGNKENILKDSVNVFRKTVRITQIDGNDISEFDLNWKG